MSIYGIAAQAAKQTGQMVQEKEKKDQKDTLAKIGQTGLKAAAAGAGLGTAGVLGAKAIGALANRATGDDPRFSVGEADKTRAGMLRAQLKEAQSPIDEAMVGQQAEQAYQAAMGPGQQAQTAALRSSLAGGLGQGEQLKAFGEIAGRGMEQKAKATSEAFKQAGDRKMQQQQAAQAAIEKETAELRKQRTARISKGMQIGGVVIDKLSESGFLDDALGIVGGAIGGVVGGPGGAALGKTIGSTAGDVIQGTKKDDDDAETPEAETEETPETPEADETPETPDAEEQTEQPAAEAPAEAEAPEATPAQEGEEAPAQGGTTGSNEDAQRVDQAQEPAEQTEQPAAEQPAASVPDNEVAAALSNIENLPELGPGNVMDVETINKATEDLFGAATPEMVNAVYASLGFKPPSEAIPDAATMQKAMEAIRTEGSGLNTLNEAVLKEKPEDEQEGGQSNLQEMLKDPRALALMAQLARTAIRGK